MYVSELNTEEYAVIIDERYSEITYEGCCHESEDIMDYVKISEVEHYVG